MVAILVAPCLASLQGSALAAPDTTTFVSRASGAAGPAAEDNSFNPSISDNGRFVAFQSNANNLSDDDDENVDENIFVRGLKNQTTTLVSRANGANGAGGNDSSSVASISAGGRFVAFQSRADNLSTKDNDAFENIFVRDLKDGTTRLVSRANGANGAAADDSSFIPSISGNGRFVAFQSEADNLSLADNNAVTNVFVRDLKDGTTGLVSRANGANGAAADGASDFPSISANGRFVAFGSAANNLNAADVKNVGDVFVRDLKDGRTRLVSRANGANGAGGDQSSGTPSISGNGRFVAFESDADNLSLADNNAVKNVFVRDLKDGTTRLVSRANGANGAAADDNSSRPSISADGRFVTFESDADNLSLADNNAVTNVFVRNLKDGTTRLVSRANGANGAGGDDVSDQASISGNGRFVAFRSDADNLSADDNKEVGDIFVRQR